MTLLTLLDYGSLPTLERKVSIMMLLTLLNYDTTNFTRLWIIAHLRTEGVNHSLKRVPRNFCLQHPRRIQGVKS
jgi:hypothetical protein